MMKTLTVVLAAALCFVLSSCGKKNDRKLAHTYFKTAFLELADEHKGHARLHAALQQINLAINYARLPEYVALKATILQYLGHPSESLEAFHQALKLPTEPGLKAQIMNNFACVLAQRKERVRAKTIWQELASSAWYATPEVAWVNLGKLYLEDQEPLRAKEAFRTAAMLAPNYIDAHFYSAVAAHAAGQLVFATEELQTVLALEPTHEQARAFAEKFALCI